MEEDHPHDKYLLQVTAGPDYDTFTHQEVPVNTADGIIIENEHVIARLYVRIQGYKGLPKGSPETSSYFSDPAHTKDQYSIALSFIPKKSVSGNDLVFGNDLDRPIRDRLPPGFSTAMRIATWLIDPGLEGDPYADKPYLYGPALSSLNILRIGEKLSDKGSEKETWKPPMTSETILEGADGSGEEIRNEQGIPADAEKRKKWFLDQQNRHQFEFEEGRVYQADFFNPYVVFNDFSLKLPGFSVSVLKYVDEKTHELRYVLKNRKTDDVLLVVLFTLLFTESSNSSRGSRASSRKSGRRSRSPGSRRASRTASVASSHKGRRSGSLPRTGVKQGYYASTNDYVPHDDDVD